MAKALTRTAVCTAELSSTPPRFIKLMPVGSFATNDGRTFRIKDAARVVERTLAYAGDRELPLDYEHQIDLSRDNGKPAPAAGWMKSLQARPDGIYAEVEWTDQAREMISQREYRYISPTFLHGKGGEVSVILRAALVNAPALDMPALAKTQDGDTTMKETLMQKILAKLGLQTDASETEVDAAMQRIRMDKDDDKGNKDKDGKGMMSTLRDLLGLEEDAGETAVTAALKAKLEPDGNDDDDSIMAQLKAINKRLDDADLNATATAAEQAVDAAIKAGKITPAQRDAMIGLAKTNREQFDAAMKVAPTLLKSGEQYKMAPEGDGEAHLSSEEKAICKSMGVSEEDYAKQRKGLTRTAAA